MEDFKQKVTYEFATELNKQEVSVLKTKFVNTAGIESFDISAKGVEISYISFQLTEKSLLKIITDLGFLVNSEKKKRKSWFKKMIDNMAKENKKTFGSGQLDCCKLNEN